MRLALSSLISGGLPLDFTKPIEFSGSVATLSEMDLFLNVESSHLTPAEQAELRHNLAMIIVSEIEEPQFRKVHDKWGYTPAGRPLFPPTVTLGSVYIVRDPRDVAVSWAHHSDITLDEAIAFLGQSDAVIGKAGRWREQFEQHLGCWSDHVASWLASDPAPLLVQFEHLSKDPLGVLSRVAAHCQINASETALAGAVEATRFNRLQQEEKNHGFELGQSRNREFFRRGIAGGWRDTLSVAQANRIAKDHGAMMTQLGYL